MSEAKRYTVVECHGDEEFWAKMKEVQHGDYVLYTDYLKLEQQNKELIEFVKDIVDYEAERVLRERELLLNKYK